MKLYHCKKCGMFIGSYGCDELCPTCRRKETYLTKEEVVTMLEDIQLEIEEKATELCDDGWWLTYNDIIQEKIEQLKENKDA